MYILIVRNFMNQILVKLKTVSYTDNPQTQYSVFGLQTVHCNRNSNTPKVLCKSVDRTSLLQDRLRMRKALVNTLFVAVNYFLEKTDIKIFANSCNLQDLVS